MTTRKAKDLTVEEFKVMIENIVEDVVDRKLVEWFGDPDEGLELTDECKESLRQSLASKEPRVTLEEVADEFGIKL